MFLCVRGLLHILYKYKYVQIVVVRVTKLIVKFRIYNYHNTSTPDIDKSLIPIFTIQ